MHWTEKSEKPPSFLQKPKTKDKLEKTRKPHKSPKPQTDRTKNWPKIPTPSSLRAQSFCTLKNNVDTFNSMNLVGSLVWKFSWLASGNVACVQPPRIVRAEQRTAMLLEFNAFSKGMALKKGEEDSFSRNFAYVLMTTTTRHMVSFIDFYIHFLASFQT